MIQKMEMFIISKNKIIGENIGKFFLKIKNGKSVTEKKQFSLFVIENK